jgi:predicted SnoaL-like aldol condensation-catalyzing enzyme
VSREVKSHNYRKHIRGAPKGQYVIIQFITDFYNKKSSIETVTPMLETDGKWRVAGYFIN